jgi:hypothetical protein
LKWEMRGTGREGARGGRRERRVEEVVCHGNFCKVRSLKMKKEREREREREREYSSKKERMGRMVSCRVKRGVLEVKRR